MAAAAFSRSSERMERWVLGLPGVGKLVADYRDGLGMPWRAKVIAGTMITVAVGISSGLFLDSWTWRGDRDRVGDRGTGLHLRAGADIKI